MSKKLRAIYTINGVEVERKRARGNSTFIDNTARPGEIFTVPEPKAKKDEEGRDTKAEQENEIQRLLDLGVAEEFDGKKDDIAEANAEAETANRAAATPNAIQSEGRTKQSENPDEDATRRPGIKNAKGNKKADLDL